MRLTELDEIILETIEYCQRHVGVAPDEKELSQMIERALLTDVERRMDVMRMAGILRPSARIWAIDRPYGRNHVVRHATRGRR